MNAQTERQLNHWIEGDLSPEQTARLHEAMAHDPDARQAYYDLLLIDHMLDGIGGGRAPMPVLLPAPAGKPEIRSNRRWLGGASLAAAAALMLGVLMWINQTKTATPRSPYPQITGSPDCRMTIAQREDRHQWNTGELMRVERGTAHIRFNANVTARFEGPAAIELLDDAGSIRLLEGRATLDTMGGNGISYSVRLPGGVIHSTQSLFITKVGMDGSTVIDAVAGDLEVSPNGSSSPKHLAAGSRTKLAIDGTWTNGGTIHPPAHDMPKELIVFRDDFSAPDKTPLSLHQPATGRTWEVLEELNPTLIRQRTLDTSSGARSLRARFMSHGTSHPQAVYIVQFRFQAPSWVHDKVRRTDGVESISLVDADGTPVLSIVATATEGHRWRLRDDRTMATSPLSPVCALWPHSLSLCYGLDGQVTLHDGSTAQAPVIASLNLAEAPPIDGLLFSNRTGGDMALNWVGATLLGGKAASGK